MVPSRRAIQSNDQGTALKDAGKNEEAIAAYLEAMKLAPKWAAPAYNLALLYKHQKDWPRSLEFNRRATVLDAKDEAAWWNLGIAATALGHWDVARAAWRGFGIPVPEGEGPIDFFCGTGPIRLYPEGDAEVVWARRIDPARARLLSIPLPESGHCFGDVVLNDGAPAGTRRHPDGREVPVFDALALLEPSGLGTFVARVAMPAGAALTARLAQLADEMGGAAEDWSRSVRMICKACSEGSPHHEHDHPLPENGAHVVGVAARDRAHATEILQAWQAERQDTRVESLDDALVR